MTAGKYLKFNQLTLPLYPQSKLNRSFTYLKIFKFTFFNKHWRKQATTENISQKMNNFNNHLASIKSHKNIWNTLPETHVNR